MAAQYNRTDITMEFNITWAWPYWRFNYLKYQKDDGITISLQRSLERRARVSWLLTSTHFFFKFLHSFSYLRVSPSIFTQATSLRIIPSLKYFCSLKNAYNLKNNKQYQVVSLIMPKALSCVLFTSKYHHQSFIYPSCDEIKI